MSKYCPSCKTDVPTIDQEGEVCCSECGAVIDDFRATVATEFAETDSGGFESVGTRVGEFGETFGRAPLGHSKESSQVTISRGKRLIETVVINMGIPNNIIQSAARTYAIGVQLNFVRGRRTNNVIAACIYVACRKNARPLPFMLIDFADYFSINVFELGHTFLKLIEKLGIRIPVVDPSIYIPRFSQSLDFGDKKEAVCKTAVRLVARMKRDWIQTGRRPAGICAASLMIAAKLHGFEKSYKDVTQVLHICYDTLRRRLNEFKNTPSSNLTPAEFDAVLDFDEIEASDPPAFTRSQIKEQMPTPILSKEELEAEIKTALGEIEQQQLDDIASSELAPLNVVNHHHFPERELPPAKRQRPSDVQEIPEYYYVAPVSTEPESLSDIEDSEIDEFINSPQEVLINKRIWDNLYTDWEVENKKKVEQAKKKLPQSRQRKPKERKEAASPSEAVTALLAQKMVSSKINESAIRRLMEQSKKLRPNIVQPA